MRRERELQRRSVSERHFDDDQREHTRCSRRFTASFLEQRLTCGSVHRSTDEHGTGGDANERDGCELRVIGPDRP